MRPWLSAALAVSLAASAVPVAAGYCEAVVVGVRPVSQYDHAAGRGFLAVREGPGTSHRQVGELYLGDLVEVTGRHGAWLLVSCQQGLCRTPLWGTPWPQGWSHGRYLRLESGPGICP